MTSEEKIPVPLSDLPEVPASDGMFVFASKTNPDGTFESGKLSVRKIKEEAQKKRGYFNTYESLIAKHPNPSEGETATAGTPFPGTVYDVVAGAWHNTGVVPSTDSIPINDYLLNGGSTKTGSQLDANINVNNLALNINSETVVLSGSIGNYTINGSTGAIESNSTRIATVDIQYLPIGDYLININSGFDFIINEYSTKSGQQYYNSGWLHSNSYSTRKNYIRIAFRKTNNSSISPSDFLSIGFSMSLQNAKTGNIKDKDVDIKYIGQSIRKNVIIDDNIVRGTANSLGEIVSSTTRLATINPLKIATGVMNFTLNSGYEMAVLQYNDDGTIYADSSWLPIGVTEYNIRKTFVRLLFRKSNDSTILLSDYANIGFSLLANVYQNEIIQDKTINDLFYVSKNSEKINISSFTWLQGSILTPTNPEYCHIEYKDGINIIGNTLYIKLKAGYRIRFWQSNTVKSGFDKESDLTPYSATDNTYSFRLEKRYYSIGIIHTPSGTVVNQTPADIPSDVMDITIPVSYERLDTIQQLELSNTIDLQQYKSCYLESDNSRRGTILSFIDIMASTGQSSLQSSVIDKEGRRLIVFNGSTDVFEFSFDRKLLRKTTKPTTGHDNDAFKIANDIYINGSTALEGEANSKLLYKYDTFLGTVSLINTSAIVNNVDSIRCIGGICGGENNKAFLVTQDYRGAYNNANDKLGVYEMNLQTQTINLLFELSWNGWFIQGATYVNGILYVATNKLPVSTSPTVYGGIAIWAIDVNSETLIDKIIIDGDVEPEGLESFVENGEVYLYMGIAKYNQIAIISKIKVPPLARLKHNVISQSDYMSLIFIDPNTIYYVY